jgi:hypothetical protein
VSRKPLADVVVAVDGRWNRAGRRSAPPTGVVSLAYASAL